MWPFRRRRDTDGANQDAAGADAPAGASPAAPSAPPARPDAWRTLPPIQRTVGEAPHTYRTHDIGEILTSWDSPRLSGELGHQVSADAPSGVLHGMTTVVDAPPGALAPSAETSVLREPPHDHHRHIETPTGAQPRAAAASPAQTLAAPPTAQRSTETSSTTAPAPTSGTTTDATHLGAGATPASPAPPDHPIGDAPLRTLSTAPAPVPTVSRVVAPDVVTPRSLPALPLQRSAEPNAAAPTTAAEARPSAAEVSRDATADGGVAPEDGASPAGGEASKAPAAPLASAPLVDPRPDALDDAGGGHPSLPPGAVLGPPIQPGIGQRRAPELRLASVQRSADHSGNPVPTGDPEPPQTTPSDASSAAEPPPSTAGPHDAARPTSQSSASREDGTATTAPLVGGTPAPVQRSADGDGQQDAHEDHAHADGTDAASGPAMPLQRQPLPVSDSPTPRVRPVGLGEPLVAPPTTPDPAEAPGQAGRTADPDPALPLAPPPSLQRQADASPVTPSSVPDATTGGDGTSSPHEAPTPEPAAVAPLLGDRPAAHDDPQHGHPHADRPVEAAHEPPLALAAAVPPPASVTVSTLRDTGLVLQRTIEDGPPTLLGHSTDAAPNPVPATRAAPTLPAGALRAPDAPLQRTTLSPASVPGRPPSAVLAGAPLSSGAPVPPMTLASPARPDVVSPAWPDPGDIAVANGVAQRMPDGSVQFTVQREGNAVRDRIAAWESRSGGGASQGPGQTAQPGGPAITATATATSEAEPAAPEGNDREALEEQARKLWPLIRRKLTNELLSRPEGRRPGW